MFRHQAPFGRLGALGVFVVASAFAWAPSASAASQPSQAVGVIPGPIVTNDSGAPCGKFVAPDYGINEPGETLPGLEIDWFERVPGDCASTGYTWTGVGLFNASTLLISGVTPAALAGLDTLVLYGDRWSSFDAASQAAINDFARTHKVVIWDADSTVAKPGPDKVPHGQDYGSYLVPFVTFASGGQKTSSNTPARVTAGDLLNSPTAINQDWLAAEPHAIGDMTVIRPADPAAWQVSIRAHNSTLDGAPGGAPSDIVVAWARGDQASGTGITIYSGIDADALDLTPTQLGTIPRNEALASFQNQLAASWCTAAPCFTAPANRTILVFASTGGAVTANPPGSACGALCYPQGTSVTLAATPNANAVFSGWGGACAAAGASPVCTVVMSTDLSVSASFAVPQTAPHRVTVTKGGDGQGTVTSSPPGVDCGPVCTGNFFSGSAVTLTATPAPGSVFLGWSGACAGTAGCALTLDADRAVTAVFSTQPRRCSVVSRTAWFHGGMTLHGTTNLPGATGVQAFSTAGKELGAPSKAPTAFTVRVDTRKLPTNRTSSIRVRLLNGSTTLCTMSTSLRVDNTKARALKVTHRRSGRHVLISFRATEAVTVKAYGKGKKPTTVRFKNTKRHTVRVLSGVKRARVQLIDRAKNLRTFYVTIR